MFISTFCECPGGFQCHSKAFILLYKYKLFIYFFRNYLSTLKILTETLLRISLFVIGQCFQCDPSLAAREMSQNLLSFRYDFKGSQSCFLFAISGSNDKISAF
jgi:hypothetical protein